MPRTCRGPIEAGDECGATWCATTARGRAARRSTEWSDLRALISDTRAVREREPRAIPHIHAPICYLDSTHPSPLGSVFGEARAAYQLIGVIMYAKNYHWISDVLDKTEKRWLRYDGIDADGVGQPTAAPHGAVRHKSTRYFPYTAVYAQVSEVVD